jgi:nitroreductase/NAD-dependent dihydropyrimidine dehydrogenase PreA subunit
MAFFSVDPGKCNRDGICAQACPTRIVLMKSPDEVPVPAQDFEENCLACGHCVAVCPTGAFSLNWLSCEECPPINRELALNPEPAEQFLRSRRSIRNFKDKLVEREMLTKLLEIACYAPSARNNQPWHWTVVEAPAEVRRLAGLVIDWMRAIIKKNPKIAENRGFARVVAAWDSGEERICRGAPHVIVVHAEKDYGFGAEDCALALSYLELFAPTVGLGACWGGYFYSAINAYRPLFNALGLPDGHRAYGAVMVGFPKLKYRRMPRRYPPRVSWI